MTRFHILRGYQHLILGSPIVPMEPAVWRGNVFTSTSCVNMLTPALLSLQYGAEFRRFSVDRAKPGKFEEFYKLILHIHRIANMEVMIGYADIHGDLLPINNDDNFCKAVSTAHPLLRIFIQRQGRLTQALFFICSSFCAFITPL